MPWLGLRAQTTPGPWGPSWSSCIQPLHLPSTLGLLKDVCMAQHAPQHATAENPLQPADQAWHSSPFSPGPPATSGCSLCDATLVHASSDQSLSMLCTPTSAVLQTWSPGPEPPSGNSNRRISSSHLKIQLKCPAFPVHLKQAWSLPSLWHFRHPCIPVFLYLSQFSPEPSKTVFISSTFVPESWGDAKFTADPR